MHPGNTARQQKLPKAPAFACKECGARIVDVQALSTTRSAGNVIANCGAVCPACKTSHVGTRTMAFRNGHLRFLSQAWDRGVPVSPKQQAEAARIEAAVAVGKQRLMLIGIALASTVAVLGGLAFYMGH